MRAGLVGARAGRATPRRGARDPDTPARAYPDARAFDYGNAFELLCATILSRNAPTRG
jgi:hypothetical protein